MKAHICIGGPLDGQFATSEDFFGYRLINPDTKKPYRYGDTLPDDRYSWERDPGMFEHLKNDYYQFNTARHGAADADVVWLHESVLKPSISPKDR